MRGRLPDKTTYNHLLSLVAESVVERVKRGVYHYLSSSFDSTMINVGKIVPGCVLCLYSAWAYYDLSVQIPQSFHIAMEKSRKITLSDSPPISLYYWKRECPDSGVVEKEIDRYRVKIYHVEKNFG